MVSAHQGTTGCIAGLSRCSGGSPRSSLREKPHADIRAGQKGLEVQITAAAPKRAQSTARYAQRYFLWGMTIPPVEKVLSDYIQAFA